MRTWKGVYWLRSRRAAGAAGRSDVSVESCAAGQAGGGGGEWLSARCDGMAAVARQQAAAPHKTAVVWRPAQQQQHGGQQAGVPGKSHLSYSRSSEAGRQHSGSSRSGIERQLVISAHFLALEVRTDCFCSWME